MRKGDCLFLFESCLLDKRRQSDAVDLAKLTEFDDVKPPLARFDL